jgi:hypothetical protein
VEPNERRKEAGRLEIGGSHGGGGRRDGKHELDDVWGHALTLTRDESHVRAST